MLRPCQRTSPAAGSSKPHSIRSRLVLPVPFGPATRSSDPASDSELEPGEQCAFAALAAEIDGIEHRQAL